MSTVIWIHTSNEVMTEALVTYLNALDYDAHAIPERPSDIAVWSLCGLTGTVPLPPPLPTLALLCYDRADNAELIEILRFGYRGFLRPEEPPQNLGKAIKAVLQGEVWAPRNLISYALVPANLPQLTPKEVQVLNLVRLGLSNKEIGLRLGNAEGTIKTHVTAILEKLSVKRRMDLLIHPANSPREE